MKYLKEDLEKYIFQEKMTYKEIGRLYGVTGNMIRKTAKKKGIVLPIRAVFDKDFMPHNKKYKYCRNCGEEFIGRGRKFSCSKKCDIAARLHAKYQDFLNNNEKYCRAEYKVAAFKKNFLKEQDCKCAICSMSNDWNDKLLVFVLDHIDGNAANNKRDNLRLVCPNCDSQLDTYKSKNKISARRFRYNK